VFDSNFNFPDNYCPILAHSHVDRHCRCCLALHCNLYHISIFDSVCFLYLLASVLLAYFYGSMHGHLFPLLSTIVARYPLSWTELMLGMASHHQLFAVVFVNSLMLPTPSLESTKFAGHQETTVCPNFALWLFRLLGYCKKKLFRLREPLRPEATERSLAPIQMYSAVFFAVADASLQPYFLLMW